MAVGEETNAISFYKDPPPRVTGVTVDGNGTVKPKVKDEFGAEICSINDLQIENLSNNGDSEVLTTPCCSRKV